MKKTLILLFFMFVVAFAITIETNNRNTYTVENDLTTVNAYEYKALNDSIAGSGNLHKVKTSLHSKADNTTIMPTGTCRGFVDGITSAIAIYNFLAEHMVLDSCHAGIDTTTVLPKLINTNVGYPAYKNFVDSVSLAWKSHQSLTMSNKYYILGDDIGLAWLDHCGRDTTGVDSCHKEADTVYNTVAIDTTNRDSLIVGLNRFKARYIPHTIDTLYHQTPDSVNLWDETLYPDLTTGSTWTEIFDFENYAKNRYNSHVVMSTDSTYHIKADTNLITRADIIKNGGHIIADTSTFTGFGHLIYEPTYYDVLMLQYSGSSVSTGATFYNYGSIDGIDWFFIDSLNVTDNEPVPKHITTFYPFYKTFLKTRADGTYNIKLKGGK